MKYTTSPTTALIAYLTLALHLQTSTALPLETNQRSPICGAAPTAPTGTRVPLTTPSATTAADCSDLCLLNPSCRSFAFGLPPDAANPICELYGVFGADVPWQAANLVVYDRVCEEIPSTEPTPANPHGLTLFSGDELDGYPGPEGQGDDSVASELRRRERGEASETEYPRQ
ncbi:uncharacterized protein BCR38DRAFT_451983 [Pseudomassariella vexata]|uniref:Apple domain-containing protein n=1 Tax=Pseudomassariella vexata TaxID=1141098 RepID=A0A1Y2D8N4_9PEZI|nr:uncharacterized protein BCR38DRAFT_451983 [Pseudomassariella vexata]ORY55621.1 hypothetical protein BCR38DRAFT_451983 [Pseudomassariella vexata]